MIAVQYTYVGSGVKADDFGGTVEHGAARFDRHLRRLRAVVINRLRSNMQPEKCEEKSIVDSFTPQLQWHYKHFAQTVSAENAPCQHVCSQSYLNTAINMRQSRLTKVDNFEKRGIPKFVIENVLDAASKDNVFRLNVAVNDPVAVEVRQSTKELPPQPQKHRRRHAIANERVRFLHRLSQIRVPCTTRAKVRLG